MLLNSSDDWETQRTYGKYCYLAGDTLIRVMQNVGDIGVYNDYRCKQQDTRYDTRNTLCKTQDDIYMRKQ